MWLGADGEGGDPNVEDAVERVLPRLEAVLQFSREVRERLDAVGVDGMAGALALYRRLRAVLDAIPTAEIERMQAEIASFERTLTEVTATLEELRRLKHVLGA